MKYPSSLENLIKSFEVFPGIGPKTAERLALYLVTKMKKEAVLSLSDAIKIALESLGKCTRCGAISEHELCDVCLDAERDTTLMIVENSKDVLSFEKTGVFHGKYHVLGGLISPLSGIGPEAINLSSLVKRCEEEHITEVVLSLSSTVAGEMTALYIRKILENSPISVYQIGVGLPVGADIEYADEITLKKALEGRKKI